MEMRPQDRMMQARGEAPQESQEAPGENPMDMLNGLTPDMINSMTEEDAKGILTQLVSVMQPEPPAPPMQ